MTAARLTTSPFFFVHPGSGGNAATDVLSNRTWRDLSLDVFRIQQFFLEPRSLAEAEADGFTAQVVEQAAEIGLLIKPEASPQLWEAHNWSRAAFTEFSQTDLEYLEPVKTTRTDDELKTFRRQTLRGMQEGGGYPAPLLAEGTRTVPLPAFNAEAEPGPSLNSRLKRRCLRSFSAEPVPAPVLANILYRVTQQLRAGESHRATGDPFAILDSLYSWINLYLGVQAVEGLAPGFYQYDVAAHSLRLVRDECTPEDIRACNSEQPWIRGGGFCVFLVAQWERYQWPYRHSRAYLHLLIQAGEFGQLILDELSRYGLGAWMTPAVHESRCADRLRLDTEKQDVVYFMKAGYPTARSRARRNQ
jgi:SagB-type dehydrogenase family enzyme